MEPHSHRGRIANTLLKAIVVICFLLPALTISGTLDVNNIRVAKNGQMTRVVFDTSIIPSYRIFTLNHPSRVVIDLADAKLATDINQTDFNASFVERLRHARRPDNKLRIVLDLKENVIPKSFVLPAQGNAHHRLVIDLNSTQSGSRLATNAAASQGNTRKPANHDKSGIHDRNKGAPQQSSGATTPDSSQKDIISEITTPAPATPKKAPALITTKSKPGRKTLVVAIDPGHGGKDPGALGFAGTREKDVVLQIAKRLERLVNAETGMRAVMTRDTDRFLTLRGRLKKAREHKADIFISIHADAIHDRRVRGSSVYVLSKNGASSEAARFLARTHNEYEVIGGVELRGKGKDVQKVLVDLSQAATIDASMKLASSVKQELGRIGKTRKTIEHAGFAVLKSPDIPSILVETAFISNAIEEKKLRSATHQQKLATSMFRGLKAYLRQHAPKDAIIAENTSNQPHTIKHGETLSEIAMRYSVSVDAIRETNSLSTDRIRAGQKLIIPGA